MDKRIFGAQTSTVVPAHWLGPPGARPSRAPRVTSRRGDIQGLRAVLMAQVLLFHAWTIGSPIGVDSFIMISAYLMTSSFLRRSENGKMPRFLERWGNTFKRLLPPLVVTVLVTLGASLMILPVDRWKETTVQAFASITYWENWRLVEVAANYYANDSALSSPLQHLWSMSMQGQIFLLWPLLMTLCVLAARRMNMSIRGTVAVAFGVLTVASLVWLLVFAPSDGSVYFDTRARIWEFAFGSMVAAVAPWLRLPKRYAPFIVTTAFVTLVVYCVVSIGTYPGPMAIVPMASVSALLLYLPDTSETLVALVLGSAPLVALGNISYAVYLVHWPIFVLYLVDVNRPSLGFVEGIALIALSIAVAWVLTALVDDPLGKLPWANASTIHKYIVVVVSLLVGVVPVALVYGWIGRQEALAADVAGFSAVEDSANTTEGSVDLEEVLHAIPLTGPGSDGYPGARVLLGNASVPLGVDPIPSPFTRKEWAVFPEECSSWVKSNFDFGKNSFCNRYAGSSSATERALIVGNSHAQQLFVPQIQPILMGLDWSAEAILKGACTFGWPAAYEGECVEHNQKVLDYIAFDPPDYVFLVATKTTTDSPGEQLVPGVVELAEVLTEQGIQVIALRDNPRSEQNLYECSQDVATEAPWGGCLLPRNQHLAEDDIMLPLSEVGGVHVIDMSDAFCVEGMCPTIIGNVYVYLDDNHVTVPYSKTIAPYFSERVLSSLGMLLSPSED